MLPNKRRISSSSSAASAHFSFKIVCSLLIQLYYAHLLVRRSAVGVDSFGVNDVNLKTAGFFINGSSYENGPDESYNIIFSGADISIEPSRDRPQTYNSNERIKNNDNRSFFDLDSVLSGEQEFHEEDLDDKGEGDNDDDLVPDNSVYNLPSKIILSTLAATASIITVCGNLLVMTSFFLDRQIRNPTNYFLLSLAISDFLIGLFSIPFLTLYLMIGEWPFGQVICNLWLSLDYTVCLTSIYTVLFITIDRFCSVKIPAKYRKWRTPNKIIVMVLLTWIIPISLFFTSIFGWSYGTGRPFDPKNCDVAWADNKVFSVTLVFSYFWSTLIVIVVLYVFIYQVALDLERKSREKQRKLSSLVGASASNTGALVSVVALGVNNKKMANKSGGTAGGGPGTGGTGGAANGGNNPSNLLKNSMKLSKKSNQQPAHHSEDTGTPDDADDEDTGPRATSTKFAKGFLNRKKNKTSSTGEADAQTAGSKNALSNNRIKNSDRKVANNQDSSSQLLGTTTSNQENSSDSKTQTNSNSTTGGNKKQTSNNMKSNQPVVKSRNKSNASTVMTNNSSANYTDDMSSSYESHSDFDTANSNRRPLIVVKSGNTLGVNNNQPVSKKLMASTSSTQAEAQKPATVVTIPQPRPESLAVMSHDTFAEKLASSTASLVKNQSSNVDNIKSPTPPTSALQTTAQSEQSNIKTNNNNSSDNNNNSNQQQTIPFIDDDFDDLSYVLHRRQLEPNTKLPVKEETIIIKTPLSFLQRITTPLRSSFSRKNSISHTRPTTVAANTTSGVQSTDAEAKSAEQAGINTNTSLNRSQATTIVTVENEASKPSSSPKLGVSFNNQPTTSDDFSDASKSTKNKSTNTTSQAAVVKSTTFNTATGTATTTTSSTMTTTSRPPQPQMNSKRKKQHENRARKALRTITFILGAFITCFAPWHVVSIYNSFCSPWCWSSRVYHHFFYSCYFLCYMNSPINPFMYALANQQFKKTFCRILKGDLRKL